MKWLTMDSAPKDGTTILLKYGDVVITGSWLYYTTPDKGSWLPDALDSHGCGCCGSSDGDPQGWMPVPKEEYQSN